MNTFLAAVIGAVTWSFMEYVIHRWGGHDRRLVKRTPFGVEHTRHHSQGNYFAPTWKKVAMASVVTPAIALPVGAVVGLQLGTAFSLGFVASYLLYEWLHRRLHVSAGIGPYARWARKHHFYHHFHKPSVNHGVTTPFWDWMFGTLEVAEVVNVPERLAMVWLCDEQGEVHRELRQDFTLRRLKAHAA